MGNAAEQLGESHLTVTLGRNPGYAFRPSTHSGRLIDSPGGFLYLPQSKHADFIYAEGCTRVASVTVSDRIWMACYEA